MWLIDIKLKLELILRYYQKLIVASCTFNILKMVGGWYPLIYRKTLINYFRDDKYPIVDGY